MEAEKPPRLKNKPQILSVYTSEHFSSQVTVPATYLYIVMKNDLFEDLGFYIYSMMLILYL